MLGSRMQSILRCLVGLWSQIHTKSWTDQLVGEEAQSIVRYVSTTTRVKCLWSGECAIRPRDGLGIKQYRNATGIFLILCRIFRWELNIQSECLKSIRYNFANRLPASLAVQAQTWKHFHYKTTLISISKLHSWTTIMHIQLPLVLASVGLQGAMALLSEKELVDALRKLTRSINNISASYEDTKTTTGLEKTEMFEVRYLHFRAIVTTTANGLYPGDRKEALRSCSGNSRPHRQWGHWPASARRGFHVHLRSWCGSCK